MRVFVSLGERSASNYVYEIFKDFGGVEFIGITDERLESLGFKSVARIEELSVVGIVEALPKIPKVYRL
ncbi:MAG: lipid-A-disaccharide synthase, partial [Candidatus Aenigmatarchaeota archaeon]